MKSVGLEARMQGVLLGAAIGGELGVLKSARPGEFNASTPKGLRSLAPVFSGRYPEHRGRMIQGSALPLTDLGVRTYLLRKGRPAPEDFAALLMKDEDISAPDYAYDGLHSTQEVLREGMHPRLAGLGNAPCGLICAAMPAVGLFHYADPERAYLEGVELASVAQPRLGADWAGLCAAAVSAALVPEASTETVTEQVLSIARAHHQELFYELDVAFRAARKSEDCFLEHWLSTGCKTNLDYRHNWVAPNPIRYALTLLEPLSDDPALLLNALLAADPGGMTVNYNGHAIAVAIAGALAGALHGPDVFPADWRRRGRRHSEKWVPILGVVKRRVIKEECQAIEIITALAETQTGPEEGMSLLHEKILGNILAGAIGNAMGSPVEGCFHAEIDQRYPDGITTVLMPERLETEDDNQMAMLLTETYLTREGAPVMARHFGKIWEDRLNRQHFWPLCMGNAYDMIRSGMDARITGHWSVVTGSTVMCLEPAGLYNTGMPGDAMLDARAISYMYQRGLDVEAASGMAAAVAAAMDPEATVDSIIDAALKAASTKPLRCFDSRPFRSFRNYLEACLDIAARYDDVFAVRKELYEKCLLYHMIDPMELWGFALAMFKVADGDVRLSAIGGTNIGRDSDTIAGRAAMLAGTLRGAGAIPPDWVALFPPPVIANIRRKAASLADLIAGQRLAVLAQRQRMYLAG